MCSSDLGVPRRPLYHGLLLTTKTKAPQIAVFRSLEDGCSLCLDVLIMMNFPRLSSHCPKRSSLAAFSRYPRVHLCSGLAIPFLTYILSVLPCFYSKVAGSASSHSFVFIRQPKKSLIVQHSYKFFCLQNDFVHRAFHPLTRCRS